MKVFGVWICGEGGGHETSVWLAATDRVGASSSSITLHPWAFIKSVARWCNERGRETIYFGTEGGCKQQTCLHYMGTRA